MKFGEQLRASIIPEYQWCYLDYDGLKRLFKSPSGPVATLTDSKGKEYTGRQWVDEDETNFVRKLESELDKVFTKKTVKSLEITRRIQVAERDGSDGRAVGHDGKRDLGDGGNRSRTVSPPHSLLG